MMGVQIGLHYYLVGTSIYHRLFSLSLSLQPHVSISCVDTQCANLAGVRICPFIGGLRIAFIRTSVLTSIHRFILSGVTRIPVSSQSVNMRGDSSCESNAFKEHIERVTTMYTTTTHNYCR